VLHSLLLLLLLSSTCHSDALLIRGHLDWERRHEDELYVFSSYSKRQGLSFAGYCMLVAMIHVLQQLADLANLAAGWGMGCAWVLTP